MGRTISAGTSAIKSVFQIKAACKRKQRTQKTLNDFVEGWTYSGIYPWVLPTSRDFFATFIWTCCNHFFVCKTVPYNIPPPLTRWFTIGTPGSLFPQYSWEQTTFYHSASYCGRLCYLCYQSSLLCALPRYAWYCSEWWSTCYIQLHKFPFPN